MAILPMHILILYKCDYEALRLLYDMYPESVKVFEFAPGNTYRDSYEQEQDRFPPADTLDDASTMVALQLR